jgi:hypothetical protein
MGDVRQDMFERASLSSITSVAGTITASTTLLATSASRLFASVYNDSTAVLYIALGSTCTTTTYTTQIPPGGYYEVPSGWVGNVTGVWAAANGNARITALS